MASGVDRVSHWQVTEGDYSAAPDIPATWFVDPPYQTKAGSYYPKQPDSHEALGAWCIKRQGQVIACDQVGADWLPWTSGLDLKSGDNSKKVSREVVFHRSIHPGLFT